MVRRGKGGGHTSFQAGHLAAVFLRVERLAWPLLEGLDVSEGLQEGDDLLVKARAQPTGQIKMWNGMGVREQGKQGRKSRVTMSVRF